MNKFLTILHDDLTEELVKEPESPYGFTYADYLNWNFKERIELIRGKIFKMSPTPSVAHQKISANIENGFAVFLKDSSCQMFHAPVDVKLKGKPFKKRKLKDDEITTVVQPDIIVVCDPEKLNDPRCIDGAPELVVEILSPGNTTTEMKHKFDLYQDNAVLEYWVVYPEYFQVHVYVLNEKEKYDMAIIYAGNENINSVVLKGLSIPMHEIFKLTN